MMKSNSRGVITIDFLFAFTFIFSLVYLLFVVSFSFFMTEVTQYITFSSARAYYAGHLSNSDQVKMAKTKFLQLTQAKQSPVSGLFKQMKWYILSEPLIGKFGNDGYNYPNVAGQVLLENYDVTTTPHQNTFWGVRVEFIPKVLDFSLPLIGSTNEKAKGTGEIFKTNIQSFLGREVSMKECLQFNANRLNLLQQKHSRYNRLPKVKLAKVADNGC